MASLHTHPHGDRNRPLTAIIIGADFAGIGMAIALRQAGITDFLILEKAHQVGGAWRDNSYPGAACDVPSHLYSFFLCAQSKLVTTVRIASRNL